MAHPIKETTTIKLASATKGMSVGRGRIRKLGLLDSLTMNTLDDDKDATDDLVAEWS